MLDPFGVKLAIAVVAQGVFDAYMLTGKQRKTAQDWFKSEEFREFVQELTESGIRFKHMFGGLSEKYSWKDIPELIKKMPYEVYMDCKPGYFLDDTLDRKFELSVDHGVTIRKIHTAKKEERHEAYCKKCRKTWGKSSKACPYCKSRLVKKKIKIKPQTQRGFRELLIA